jgi:hypothetical protein
MIYAFAIWLALILAWAYGPTTYARWRLRWRWRRLQRKIARIQSRIR